MTLEVDQPSTSLDQTEQSEPKGGAADAGSPSQDSTNLGTTQGSSGVGDADDNATQGDNDAAKDSDNESELESDEEELLRVMARCNPIFITFSK